MLIETCAGDELGAGQNREHNGEGKNFWITLVFLLIPTKANQLPKCKYMGKTSIQREGKGDRRETRLQRSYLSLHSSPPLNSALPRPTRVRRWSLQDKVHGRYCHVLFYR
jgi:hypothetical protein